MAFETVPMFVSVTDDVPLSSFQGRSFNAFFFLLFFQPGDRWSGVRDFELAGCVSSYSTHQIFRNLPRRKSLIMLKKKAKKMMSKA